MKDAIEWMNRKDLDGRSITVNESHSGGGGGGRLEGGGGYAGRRQVGDHREGVYGGGSRYTSPGGNEYYTRWLIIGDEYKCVN